MKEIRCRCGMPAVFGQFWCERCLDIRDREMDHCMIRIRLGTRLELSSQDVKDLMLSYLKRSTTDGKA